jgi:hypothetical protein
VSLLLLVLVKRCSLRCCCCCCRCYTCTQHVTVTAAAATGCVPVSLVGTAASTTAAVSTLALFVTSAQQLCIRLLLLLLWCIISAV